jgi:hypothetical protein
VSLAKECKVLFYRQDSLTINEPAAVRKS